MLNPIDVVVELVRTSGLFRTIIIWGTLIFGVMVIGVDNILSTLGLQDEAVKVSQFFQRNIDVNAIINQLKQLFK